jgi:hypothetical protein
MTGFPTPVFLDSEQNAMLVFPQQQIDISIYTTVNYYRGICLCIYCLFNDAVSSLDYMTSIGRTMNWKRFGNERWWFNLRYFLPGAEETHKTLSQDRVCPVRESNWAPHEYKSKAFPPETA